MWTVLVSPMKKSPPMRTKWPSPRITGAARDHGARARLDLAKHARPQPTGAHAIAETRLDAIEGQEKRCIGGGFG